jgi:hypothetical protein
MEKEQLITLKTAKLAKKKGLDEFGFSNTFVMSDGVYYSRYNWKQDGLERYSAPTQSLLQKWLREVHGFEITPLLASGITQRKYIVMFQDIDDNGYQYWKQPIKLENKKYDSYEEALEKGLQEALKLI